MEEHKHEHHHHHHHEHGGHEHGEEKELSVKAIVTAGVLFVVGILLEHLPLENWVPSVAAATIPGLKLGVVGVLSMLCYLAAYLICGKDVVVGAVSNVIHGEFLDEAFLMTVSSIGALVLGEYGEATTTSFPQIRYAAR